LHAEVERAFVHVLSLQLRLATEQQAARLVADAENLARKRVAAGEDSRLDGNLARVEAERARNQVAQLAERLTEARAELAALLRLPPDTLPEVAGELETAPPAYTLADLLAATESHPALQALTGKEAAAKARVDLERGAAWPEITLGLSVAREGPLDARDKITGVNLSLPLPLFRRNQAAIGRAFAEHTQAQAERESGQRETLAKVHTLWAQLASLRERVRGLSETVQPALDENRRLSLAAYKYGELGLPQLLMVQRQALDGQRDLLEARTDLRLTRIALEAAAGWQPR
jgi:cobalt-zinc-cadmium efflux system outer membrane protein